MVPNPPALNLMMFRVRNAVFDTDIRRCDQVLAAVFRLERAIAPHRPPSTTVAINRNAQFVAHTDKGSGAGLPLFALQSLPFRMHFACHLR